MFWRIRLEKPEWHKKNGASPTQNIGLGGGNFTMVLALLAACSFLAKVYRLLKKPNEFVSAEEVVLAKKALEIVKEHPKFAKIVKNGKLNWIPREGDCNESNAFSALVRDLHKDGIDLGVEDNDAAQVWTDFRNRLAHMAFPDGIVAVYADQPKRRTAFQAEKFIREGRKSFEKGESGWMCVADRLSLDISDISEWLCQKIDEESEDSNVLKLQLWISK